MSCNDNSQSTDVAVTEVLLSHVMTTSKAAKGLLFVGLRLLWALVDWQVCATTASLASMRQVSSLKLVTEALLSLVMTIFKAANALPVVGLLVDCWLIIVLLDFVDWQVCASLAIYETSKSMVAQCPPYPNLM
jgi:hypothetical protein